MGVERALFGHFLDPTVQYFSFVLRNQENSKLEVSSPNAAFHID